GTASVLTYPAGMLVPETARNFSAGLDFRPRSLPNLHLALNYYNLKFDKRIVDSPLGTAFLTVLTREDEYGPLIGRFESDADAAAFVSDLIAQGYTVFDLAGAGTAGLRYSFPQGKINATLVR